MYENEGLWTIYSVYAYYQMIWRESENPDQIVRTKWFATVCLVMTIKSGNAGESDVRVL